MADPADPADPFTEFESVVTSEAELAEVIYHASGYAGFPAAATARVVAAEALRK